MQKKDKKPGLFARFVRYYRPYKWMMLADLGAAFIVSLCDMAYPLIARRIMYSFVPDKNLKMLLLFCGLLLGIYLVKRLFNYFITYYGHGIGVNMQADMRAEIFSHLESLPFSYFDKNKSGSLMSRVVNDLQDVSELAHHGPENFILSVLMILGSFGILMTINWKLSLIIFAFVPVLTFFVGKRRLDMGRAAADSREKIGQINAELSNSLSGIRVAKAFDNEDGEIDRFGRSNAEYRTARRRYYRMMALFQSGMTFYIDIMYFVVITAGGLFSLKGEITLVDYTTFLLYISTFISPLRKLGMFFEQFEDGKEGFRRFCEVMDERPEYESPKARPVEHLSGDIVFDHVSFRYGEDKQVLSDLCLTIKEGHKVALEGPSGGGKTTLCHLLPRFYPLSAGSITIGGRNIEDITLSSLRQKIGIVQQDVFLFTGTIADNIGYAGRDASREQIIEAARKAMLHDFVMTLPDGYDTYIGERGVMLSGGQKQRIAIARIFVKNPEIVILDEATSALDNATEAQLQQSLDAMCHGRTSIVVAHRLSTIKNADEIVVITDSGIEAMGTHEVLMQGNSLYKELYEMQFRT